VFERKEVAGAGHTQDARIRQPFGQQGHRLVAAGRTVFAKQERDRHLK
jgi:hypothetical protein